jgi:cytoskeletal protein CcmA (bactofilin family)
MASTIKLKRSLTPGAVPGSLAAGELAINIPDKKLFSSNGSSVFNVSGDQYNLTSSTHDLGASVTLTVDNEALSNDAITFIGGTGTTITRNANGTITFNSTGSPQADALSSAVTVQLTGDVTGSATFQNAGDTASISTTIQPNSVALGTDTTGNYAASVANTDNNVVITGSAGEGTAFSVGLAGTISSDTTGNAATATQLATARNITLSGDVSGTASFDGSGDASITATIQADSVALGTDTTGNYAAAVTGTTNEIEITGSAGEGTTFQIGLPDNVTIGNNLTVTGNTAVSGDLTVDGNLEVNGTLTYIDSTTVTIGDNMLKLANTNNADTVDMGFYSLYNNSGNKYTGLVRDATDSSYYLFDGLTTEPGQTINFGSVNLATLNAVIDGGTF